MGGGGGLAPPPPRSAFGTVVLDDGEAVADPKCQVRLKGV